jgi:hypothetical protein
MPNGNVESAAQRLRNDVLGEALDRWEAEDAPFDDDELAAAAAALKAQAGGMADGYRRHPPSSTETDVAWASLREAIAEEPW